MSKIKYFYMVLSGFVLLDILLFLILTPYRNVLGVVKEDDIFGIFIRLIPDIFMLVFYLFFFIKIIKLNYISTIMVKWHSAICIFIGLLLCIPWVGIFFTSFTPIGFLYISLILWLEEGYYFGISLALVFVLINFYILIRQKR
ncbi:hypothetical protein MNBD_GAMMA22-1250 [hydrothermal vent metagenome]|uniref:Uncharacterized protein n=1 Tax=hydrothermal vent metagenome TaxID=652676 RepID=A0A3B1AA64_9ZZZZ